MEKSVKRKKYSFIYQILPWFFICLGIILRLRQYLFDRSLWSDEAALALNIINRPFLGFFQPLNNDQGAPIVFLIIEKIIVKIFGNNELALRLFPFFCGVMALFIFYELAKKCIEKKILPIAIALFAIMGNLIYFSSEVKQYSSDVLVCLLLYMAGINILQKKITVSRSVFLGFLGAGAIWVSYPAVFFLGSICTVNLFYLNQRKKNEKYFLFGIFVFWALSFSAYYFSLLRTLAVNEYLLAYWREGFMPLSLGLKHTIKWFFKSFYHLFEGFKFNGIAAFLFIMGCIAMFFKKREMFLLMFFSFFYLLLASALRKYPFKGRMILFIVPTVVLLIGSGIEWIKIMFWDKSKISVIVLVALLFCHPLHKAYSRFKSPTQREELRPVIKHVINNKQKGDLLYVYYASPQNAPAFRYYSNVFGLDEEDYIIGIMSRDDRDKYVEDLKKLCGHKRVWIIFSHVVTLDGVNEEKFFLINLNNMGTQLESFKKQGASAYLYDLCEK